MAGALIEPTNGLEGAALCPELKEGQKNATRDVDDTDGRFLILARDELLT